jgi:hypothetical protein
MNDRADISVDTTPLSAAEAAGLGAAGLAAAEMTADELAALEQRIRRLEDVVSGLMTAAIRRVIGDAPPQPAKKPKPAGTGEVIDLADEGAHE